MTREVDAANVPGVSFLDRPLGRRSVLRWGGAALLGAGLSALGGRSWAATPTPQISERIRIGVVVPGTTGSLAVESALYDLAGDAARTGALLADNVVDRLADRAGNRYRMLTAHAPTPEAARRAAERLVAVEEITALIGGIGRGQADALADVAEAHDIPLFNIGDSSDDLRRRCLANAFHIEASDAMFLDALVDWHASQGRRRWFLVDDPERTGGIVERLTRAIERYGRGGHLVGATEVVQYQPTYSIEARDVVEAEADVVLVAVDVQDEILVRYALLEVEIPLAIAALPSAVTQTRDFLAASRVRSRHGVPDQRLLTWETTLASYAADDLNERFVSRAAQPMDPTGWTAYQSIIAYYAAVVAAGSVDSASVRRQLVASEAFESVKGPGVSFRTWDHQLRQPLYVVEMDHDAPWGASLSRRIGVASLVGVLPDDAADDVITSLDRYGDGPTDGPC